MKLFLICICIFGVSLICMANPADSLTLVHVGTSCTKADYSIMNGSHRFSGAGEDIWKKADDFDFACIPLTGDMQITAKISSLEYVEDSTKAGIMIRNNLAAGSIFACAYSSTQYLAYRHRGTYRNSCKTNKIFTDKLFSWLRLIRQGNLFIFQHSFDGKDWRTVEIKTLNMQDTVYYGLAVASNLKCTSAKAVFDNVSIVHYNQHFTREMQNALIGNHIIKSENVKDSFKIFVGLPSLYDSTKTTAYPVAYHLDGGDDGWHYILRNYMAGKQIPEVISVGIGYPDADMRERDFTTGFADFYKFIKDELIPFIDKTYKTKPENRTLFGFSLGGLCATRTLLEYGNAMPFQNIISGSPSLWWPDGVFMFTCEQDYYKKYNVLPVNFYMAMGSDEIYNMVPDFQNMSAIFDSRNYEHFKFMHALNQGKNHDSNKDLSFRDGHLWALNQPLPPVLDQNNLSIKNRQNFDGNKVSVYPNPAKNALNIYMSELGQSSAKFEIVSLSGQTMQNGMINQPAATINVSGLQPGMYLLRLNLKGEKFNEKISIE